jgi:hypothetical protein
MKGKIFKEPQFHMAVNGEKTQFREIIKPQPGFSYCTRCKKDICSCVCEFSNDAEANKASKCNTVEDVKPRYRVGETVYLKEPYDRSYIYARYFIKITAVRYERLQAISDEDCMKSGISLDFIEENFFHYHDYISRCYCADCEYEGRKRLIKEALENRDLFGFDDEEIDDEWIKEELDSYSCGDHTGDAITCDICGKYLSAYGNGVSEDHFTDKREAYAEFVDKIHGKGTWERDPFVWVYEFKLTNKNNRK